MRIHSQLQLRGGWGVPTPPAFSFDLLAAAVVNSPTLQRYGRAPGIGSDDRRPLAPKYQRIFNPAWSNKSGVTKLVGDADALARLLAIPSYFGGNAGLSFTDARISNAHAFALPIALMGGESLGVNAFIYPVDKGASSSAGGHVWHVRIGNATGGVLFQIRDGSAEVARMSTSWTRAQETTLRGLWALPSPTDAQIEQTETLTRTIYSAFESLSFERSVGRDNWIGSDWKITLVPEPRGALHVILEGADGSMIEFPDLLEQDNPPPLWGDGAIVEVGATGGAWVMQPTMIRFNTANITFGPYRNGFWADSWDTCEYATSFGAARDSSGNPLANLTFERVAIGDVTFEFRAKFTTTDARFPAWLYALSARLPNGPRDNLESDIYSDSDNPYTPAGGGPRETNPIIDVQLNCDEGGARSATVIQRDVNGRTSMPSNIDALIGRVADLDIEAVAFLRGGIVSRGRATDMATFARTLTGGTLRRLGIDVAKAASLMELTIDEGWQLLDEAFCDPPPIGDGLYLGEQIRRLLRVLGFTEAEIAGVPENIGPILDKARAGQSWANCPDANSTVGSAIDALLDRYGLGLRFYRASNGVWTLEQVPTTIKAAFTSNYKRNDPLLKRGGTRHAILAPLDWERDQTNFHNIFRVIGAVDLVTGEPIVRSFVDRQSISGAQAGNARWLGRAKRYPTLRDDGMKTEGAVNYALRSLRYRFGRPGLMAQFETYLDTSLRYLDRVTCDGVLCEIVSWSGSTAEDRMQIRVRELV